MEVRRHLYRLLTKRRQDDYFHVIVGDCIGLFLVSALSTLLFAFLCVLVKSRTEFLFWAQRLNFVYKVELIKSLWSIISYDVKICDPRLDRISLLWDIMIVTYQDQSSFSVYNQKVELKRRWKEPTWVIGKVVNPAEYPDEAVPCLWRQVAFAFFFPVWMLCGFLTLGYLIPSQVRHWLLCPSVIFEIPCASKNPPVKEWNPPRNRNQEGSATKVTSKPDLVEIKLQEAMTEIKTLKENFEDIKKAILYSQTNTRVSTIHSQKTMQEILSKLTALQEKMLVNQPVSNGSQKNMQRSSLRSAKRRVSFKSSTSSRRLATEA